MLFPTSRNFKIGLAFQSWLEVIRMNWVLVWLCALWDGSALSINVTQVATVSLLVSASVRVSWYHSLVSMSVRPTQFDPDPVSLLFPTPQPRVCIVSANPQIPWYVGGISAIFPGHRCLCLARCVCKFPHWKGDKHTHGVTCIYKPRHMAVHTLYGGGGTATNHVSACVHIVFHLSASSNFSNFLFVWKTTYILLANPQWQTSGWVLIEFYHK